MGRHIVALGACALLGCGLESGASTERAEPPEEERAAEYRSARVSEAIEAASEVVQTRGFALWGEPVRGFLVEHTASVQERSLRPGNCYVVIGAASAAMRELNLGVFDSDGTEVVSDAIGGPTAALRYCPSQTGTYYLVVRASAGSGLYEVRTFRGPTGLDIQIDDLFRDLVPPETGREPR